MAHDEGEREVHADTESSVHVSVCAAGIRCCEKITEFEARESRFEVADVGTRSSRKEKTSEAAETERTEERRRCMLSVLLQVLMRKIRLHTYLSTVVYLDVVVIGCGRKTDGQSDRRPLQTEIRQGMILVCDLH